MSSSPVAASVRPARTSDVDAIAQVQVRAWQASYADLLPPEVVSALSADDLAWEWGRALLGADGHRILVAVAEGSGDVVGVASVGPGVDPDVDPGRVGEIGALDIDPGHRRAGHASRLMAACVDTLREMGRRECVVWIPLDDEPRRALLQSAGWGPDGAYRDLAVGADATVRQVRLVTLIDEGPDAGP